MNKIIKLITQIFKKKKPPIVVKYFDPNLYYRYAGYESPVMCCQGNANDE